MPSEREDRRAFLRQSLGLAAVAPFGGGLLFNRVIPSTSRNPETGLIDCTYTLRISDYPTQTLPGGLKVGLTEIGSSIKLAELEELLMNPDFCDRSGRDGVDYPIAVVRTGESSFTAVSTWCPHNAKYQVDYFQDDLGEAGLFVCPHQNSCYRADGSWVPPEESPFLDAPPRDEFNLSAGIGPDGMPRLLPFKTEFDGDDLLTITGLPSDPRSKLLQECEPCVGDVTERSRAGFFLDQNAPNPVRMNTLFKFGLPRSIHVRISLYDSKGTLLRVLANRRYEAGEHILDVKAVDLPAGIYHYRLEAGETTLSRTITVVR